MKRTWAFAVFFLVGCAGDPPQPRVESAPSPAPVPVARPVPPAVDPSPVLDPPVAPNPAITPSWVEPLEPTVYLEPDSFPEAPAELRQALHELGCRIPQVYRGWVPEDYEPPSPHNLVSGYFKSLAVLHWAVFCSRSGASALLLFDSEGNLVEEIEPASKDDDHNFDRYVDVAEPQHILEDHESFGGPKPPLLLHDGIECGFSEKGSHIYYWYKCKWITLQGGD